MTALSTYLEEEAAEFHGDRARLFSAWAALARKLEGDVDRMASEIEELAAELRKWKQHEE